MKNSHRGAAGETFPCRAWNERVHADTPRRRDGMPPGHLTACATDRLALRNRLSIMAATRASRHGRHIGRYYADTRDGYLAATGTYFAPTSCFFFSAMISSWMLDGTFGTWGTPW